MTAEDDFGTIETGKRADWAKDDKESAAGHLKKALSVDPNYDPAIKALQQ